MLLRSSFSDCSASCYEIGRSFYQQSSALTWKEACLCPVPILLLHNLFSLEVENKRGALTETLNDGYPS